MKTNQYGEMIYNDHDLANIIMQGQDILQLKNLKVDHSVDIENLITLVEDTEGLFTWTFPEGSNVSVSEFDTVQQQHWHMPNEYKQLDIAEYLLNLCNTQEELQRVGEELLLFQERNLFDLIRYLKYLVDVMQENHVIWGVGRGSSVASYVLFKLGVHRIDSMFWDLDPREFLR